MRIEDFNSGEYRQEYKYKSFIPTTINREWVWIDPKINLLLSEADLMLGNLNAFSLYVPNIDVFIRMHVVKEATQSSRIEGTQTEIEEVILGDEYIQPERKDDRKEVQNYIEAMNKSISKLESLPVSTRMLRDAHKILMQGVRGEGKQPGSFRKSQNWIGGTTINDAVFVPPSHTDLNDLMGDLENFLHNENIDVPSLIKAAIIHYQFETIHPFLDGNGRIGRLLITLQLVSSGILRKPVLYISDYFEKHRTLYYDNLNRVRTNNDLGQWIKFFLVAVTETSKSGVQTMQSILELRDTIEKKKIINLGKKTPNAKRLLEELFANPIVSSNDIAKRLDITSATANSLIENFTSRGILKEISGRKRDRLFSFVDYLNLFKNVSPNQVTQTQF